MIEIEDQKCDGCAICLEACDIGAIRMVNNKAYLDQLQCTECGACIEVCPNEAIKMRYPEQQQHPIPYQQVPQSTVMSAVKSSIITVGSTLLPLVISKLGSLVFSILENWHPMSPMTKQNLTGTGKRIRRRFRGCG